MTQTSKSHDPDLPRLQQGTYSVTFTLGETHTLDLRAYATGTFTEPLQIQFRWVPPNWQAQAINAAVTAAATANKVIIFAYDEGTEGSDRGGNNPAAGDNIFIYESSTAYSGSLTLLNNQKLIGQDRDVRFLESGSREDVITGFGDLAPMFNVRWNAGVHNFMTYITGNLTTGRYDPTRLANLGIGHNAIDAGGAYTYFNPQTRHEFSATLGFTYNFENVHTDYQNGIDMHLDVGASQVLTKQLQVGLVGYWYNQLSCDTGTGDRVGCFESRVAGIHHPDQPGIPRLHQPERL